MTNVLSNTVTSGLILNNDSLQFQFEQNSQQLVHWDLSFNVKFIYFFGPLFQSKAKPAVRRVKIRPSEKIRAG